MSVEFEWLTVPHQESFEDPARGIGERFFDHGAEAYRFGKMNATRPSPVTGDHPAVRVVDRAPGRPLRLAYVVNCFPNFIETMIYREVIALRAQGHDIYTISIRRPPAADVPPEAESLARETIYILPVGGVRLLAAHLRALLRRPVRYWTTLAAVVGGTHTRLRDRLRTLCHFAEAVAVLPVVERMRVDHLHAHWAVGAATVAMVLSRLLDIPFTFTAHAYDIWRDRLILAEKLRAARLALTCTEYNRRHLIEAYCVEPSRVRVVYHGLDLDRFRPRERPANREPVILSVGRLVEQKGFDRLLRACARLLAEGQGLRCEIVGEGPLRDRLETLAGELGLGDRVRFRGRLFQEALIGEYARADVFALVCVQAPDNDRDGIPNTLIEAMAMGLPVVSTRYAGIPELVEDGVTGHLVEPYDLGALAAAVRELLRDAALRERMGKAGRQRVVGGFSIARSAGELQGIFAALAAERAGAMTEAARV